MTEAMIGTGELANRLGVTTHRVIQMIREGKLQATQEAPRAPWRVKLSDAQALIATRKPRRSVAARRAKLERETGETRISVELDIDGTGAYEIDTGNGMFDHMLAQLSRHGLIDLKLTARGDVEVGWHHLVEDTGIVLGRALHEAVGDGSGIMRMASFHVPLDEALALVVVDFGGRGYAVIDADIGDSDMGDLPAHLVRHFLETLAHEGRFNLHVRLLAGDSNHHKAEAIFKALARAMRAALTPDPRLSGGVPSTKGTIG